MGNLSRAIESFLAKSGYININKDNGNDNIPDNQIVVMSKDFTLVFEKDEADDEKEEDDSDGILKIKSIEKTSQTLIEHTGKVIAKEGRRTKINLDDAGIVEIFSPINLVKGDRIKLSIEKLKNE